MNDYFIYIIIKRFILLKDPASAGITTNYDTSSGNVTNPTTKENSGITLQSDFDPTNPDDNPYSFFPTAIEATYYWLSGNFVQRDNFNSWFIDLFTWIASVFLVIILQNMLIAFMG